MRQSQSPSPPLPALLISRLWCVWSDPGGQAMCCLFGRPWSQNTGTCDHQPRFLLPADGFTVAWFHFYSVSRTHCLCILCLVFSLIPGRPEARAQSSWGKGGSTQGCLLWSWVGGRCSSRGTVSLPGQLRSLRHLLRVRSHSLTEIKVTLVGHCLRASVSSGDLVEVRSRVMRDKIQSSLVTWWKDVFMSPFASPK